MIMPKACVVPILPVTTAAIAILAQNIEMVFQSRAGQFWALKGIDLEVRQGDIQILMGPSGAGKTTLLSILAGILTPTAGQVSLLGRTITAMPKTQLARFRLENVGFVFQDFNLFAALTALENIELVFNLKGINGAVARRQARSLLEQVKLGDKADRLPRDLSGGQKQRVAIARALAGNPPIILADEPTASLDSCTGHTVINLIRQLAKENHSTVVIVTHDNRIADIADCITYLEDGMLKN